jgi:serine-type D-Ala-D-Ala carboxypeptidase (penicillin-binding protein 5/6)
MNFKKQNFILSGKLSIVVLVSFCCILSSPFFANAKGPDTLQYVPADNFQSSIIPGLVADENEIRAGLLYDVSRNTIVWQKDMDYSYPIASLTKMMVGLLAIEDIEAGNICLDDKISVTRTFKKRISRRSRRYSCVVSREEYAFEDLLKMAMVASHNESTVWIARHCSGTLEPFVERMNRRAQELGMSKTQYSNTSGLPAIIDELDNSASARDMLILALEVMKHPKLMEITSIPYASVQNGKGTNTYRNHNGLVINYNQEVDGIKTGYTKAAKFCLVASSNRAGYRMISIVFGARSPWVRNGIVASMVNTYYDALKIGRLGDALPDLTESKLFLDSVNRGLAQITPRIEPRHQDSSDESYAYTYKTVTEKVKKSYTVRSGDNLGKIANRYNVSLSDIRHWNKLKSTAIHSGQHLNIYATVKRRIPVKLVVDPDESYADSQPAIIDNSDCETEVSVENSSADADSVETEEKPLVKAEKSNKDNFQTKPVVVAKEKHKVKPSFVYHTVQPGDTLWNIAQRYQANIEQIKRVNKIGNGRYLRSGTRIKIPVKGS